MTTQERIEKARALHEAGYNCAQCVVMAFADLLGEDVAANLSTGASALGGGVAGMRQACGAVTGMVMLQGALNYSSPTDKKAVTAAGAALARNFIDVNGSMVCGELLGSRKKPCMGLIADAITIFAASLDAAQQSGRQ